MSSSGPITYRFGSSALPASVTPEEPNQEPSLTADETSDSADSTSSSTTSEQDFSSYSYLSVDNLVSSEKKWDKEAKKKFKADKKSEKIQNETRLKSWTRKNGRTTAVVVQDVGATAMDAFRLSTEIAAKAADNGVSARTVSAQIPMPIANIPMPRLYSGHVIQDEKLKDFVATTNLLDLGLKTAYAGMDRVELTDPEVAMADTNWNYNVPIFNKPINELFGLYVRDNDSMDNNSNEMVEWTFRSIDGFTAPIGAKFLMTHMMSFDGEGVLGSMVGKAISNKDQKKKAKGEVYAGRDIDSRIDAIDHNTNRIATALGASAYNFIGLNGLATHLGVLQQANQAFVPSQTEIDNMKELLGEAAEGMTDEDIAELIEYAQRATSQDDVIPYLTYLHEQGLDPDQYDAESLLTQMAAMGTEASSYDGFSTLGKYFRVRSLSAGANAVATSALLRSYSLARLEGMPKSASYLTAGGVAAAQFGINQALLASAGKKFSGETGTINPYVNPTTGRGVNPALTAINAASQFGTLPMAIVADQTEHPWAMSRAFSENITQTTDAIFSPPLHFMLNDYRKKDAETTGGQFPWTLYNFLEGGVGSASQLVYGFHQGELLREGIDNQNALYAVPAVLGLATQVGKFVHYGALTKPTSDVVADAASDDGIEASHRKLSDAGWVPYSGAIAWALGTTVGAVTGKLRSEQAGGEVKRSGVQFTGSGISIDFSRMGTPK